LENGKLMSRKINLIVIDPQVDFCDTKRGALSVPGAWEAMERVATMIDKTGDQLDNIQVTLDSHHMMHIAHPIYWRFINTTMVNPKHPSPFTMLVLNGDKILAKELVDPANGTFEDRGEVTTTVDAMRPWALNYIRELENSKRFPHFIWPPHCLIGTEGQTVIEPVMQSLLRWENQNIAAVEYKTKGSYYHAEHFGAVMAQVPDPRDPSTDLDTEFIKTMMDYDLIVGCGIAGSHCLGVTVQDIANTSIFPDGDKFIKKFIWLTDGTEPVAGFEQQQQDIVDELVAKGMQTMTCEEFTNRIVGVPASV
jgi:nicotinamidase/pyrazinamidase